MLNTINREAPRQEGQTLSKTAQKIYDLLRQAALKVAASRGYHPKVAQVSYHVPAETVALAAGIHRSTLYRHLPSLVELGLIDYRAHITTANIPGAKSDKVSDGTVWSIRLDPHGNKPAKLSYEDMKHEWRDLDADRRRGRTSYNQKKQMRQSKTLEGLPVGVDLILDWTLPPRELQAPLSLTVASSPECVLDVPFAPKAERGKMVDTAAQAVAFYLGDLANLAFYRYLIWQLLRLEDQAQSYWHPLYTAIRRAGADKQEGFAKKPGALLVARMKQDGLWDIIRSVPPRRVGTKPIKA